LRVTERFHRRDFGNMDLEITMTDSKAYTKPWRIMLHTRLMPGLRDTGIRLHRE
jgi:hypothetical protein